MSKQKQNSNDNIAELLKSKDITNIYFNEFAIGVSKNDIFILIRCNGREEAILNVSHITAKTLAVKLNEVITDFEEKTNQKIMISTEVEKLLEDK